MGDRSLPKPNPKKLSLVGVYSRLLVSCCIAGTLNFFRPAPCVAAEIIVVRNGLLESSLPIADLRNYAQTEKRSPALAFFLGFIDKEQQQSLREFLQTQISVNPVALSKVLNAPSGTAVLQQVAGAILNSHHAGIQALRSAAILGIRTEGLSMISFLEAYPNKRLVLDFPTTLKLIDNFLYPDTQTDRLATTSTWQMFVDYQTTIAQNQNQPYSACLFGDSISSALGNTLGSSVYNFALGGLSSVSLVEQLRQLHAKKVQCNNAIIAIGANDAMYKTTDEQITQNLSETIALTRKMGAKQTVLLPAFYSTLAASKNPKLAGPIPRVETINQLIYRVAKTEGAILKRDELNPLFDGKLLKENLTHDGVHLNPVGIKIYRSIVLSILSVFP